MKLEVGMYVRTEEGEISKIEWFTFQSWEGLDKTVEASFWLENKERLEYPRDNFKASHNIIDLIEVGDYVNGDKVIYTNDGYVEVGEENDNIGFTSDKFIKSIVTKKQFESMSYKVGGKE